MDILLWIVLGLGVGWGLNELMLSSPGSRLVPGPVAGLVGALLGGLGMRLFDSASSGSHVNTSVAALAGALWLAWVVCVVTFGRRPDAARIVGVGSEHVRRGTGMSTYGSARDALVEQHP